MKVGLEVEFRGNYDEALAAFQEAGLARAPGSSAPRGSPYWEVKTDHCGVEVASPILDWRRLSDRRMVVKAVRTIKESGGETHDDCGIHVHVGQEGMSPNDLSAVARLGFQFEDAWFRIASSGWQRMRGRWHEFAPAWNSDLKRRFISADFEWPTVNRYARRYNAFTMYSEHGTMEFRHFNSSLNPQRILGYMGLCTATVTAAKLGKGHMPVTKYKVNPLGSMVEGTRDEDKMFRDLIRTISCKGYGLSTIERKNLARIWKEANPQPAADWALLDGWHGDAIVKGKSKGAGKAEVEKLFDDLDAPLGPEGNNDRSDVEALGYGFDRDRNGACTECAEVDCGCCVNCGGWFSSSTTESYGECGCEGSGLRRGTRNAHLG